MAVFVIFTNTSFVSASSQQSAVSSRSPDKRIPTEEWAVRLNAGEDPEAMAKAMGAENMGQIGHLPHTYLLRFPDSQSKAKSVSTQSRLRKENRIQWYEQQVARWRFPRLETGNPDDPLFSDQWHLANTGQSGGKTGEDVNVMPVWDRGFTGEGVTIAIVDDGLEHDHPDLIANYQEELSYDFNYEDHDPDPWKYDGHGTSAAGVAAARDNQSCGVGAAYRSGLAGLRLIAKENTDAEEAKSLSYQRDDIHIYSNSWGPEDDGTRLEGPGPLTLEALEDNAKNGRNGLGNIYVWAAGNGLRFGDNVNYDGYANSRFTIAVGAVGPNGCQANYSEPGAAMLITAPSDTYLNGKNIAITTTDLSGGNGESPGDCTDDFGGTSASSPLAAGIVALMLEANPNLTWRDVQHLLMKTAVKNDPGDEDWSLNGAGLHINHKYGFGRIDAAAAVELALTWQTVPEALSLSYGPENVNQSVPNEDDEGVSSVITVDQNIKLEHAEVVFTATHPCRGDIQVVLTSPSGTQSVLAKTHSRDKNADYDAWKFMTVRNWNEFSVGEWTLTVSDPTDGDSGTFDSWELILYGTHSPLAWPDEAFTNKNMPVTVDVLSNDKDPDSDTLTVDYFSKPGYGAVSENADNTITYTPKKDFIGVDSFLCTISDGRDGKDTNTVTVTVASDFALAFEGGNEYADCGKKEELNLTGPLTMEAWIYPEGWGEMTDNGYGRVADKENIVFYLNNSGPYYNNQSLIFAMNLSNDSFAASCTPENSIRLNVWQHVAATYDGVSTVKMYIDGEEQVLHQSDGPPSGPVADNLDFPLLIGESMSQDRAFEGSVDEVRIWNKVRSQAEICSALYTGLKGDEEGLVGYWPMNKYDNVITDRSGNGHEGKIFGAKWVPGIPFEVLKDNDVNLEDVTDDVNLEDVTDDVNLGDAISVLKVLSGINVKDDTKSLKDINKDGRISIEDVIYMLQKIGK
ncbi:S8 family serine peptidase [Desulfonema magnum]|uniref:Peptidase S8/S53 domain-containing protein n=1 Tax=Desulfonema magnum TaxID=45655 RepID=A0A975BN38_9BACT|nr:S8 family serine peptidase [Desulfonema magnum]QTA88490.1 Peptidase S8/S53 domain-containing protein [Desulfonema magnum]